MIELTLSSHPLEDYICGDCRVALLVRHSCAFFQSFCNETAQIWVPSVNEDVSGLIEERFQQLNKFPPGTADLPDCQALNVLVLPLGVEAHAQELRYLCLAESLHTLGDRKSTR